MTAGGSGNLTGDTASTSEQTALMRWRILCRHVEDGVPLTTLAALEGIGLRTLQRWHAAHKRDGISGLATANRGTTQRRSNPELVALVEGLALLKPRLPVATIARKANRVAADHDLSQVDGLCCDPERGGVRHCAFDYAGSDGLAVLSDFDWGVDQVVPVLMFVRRHVVSSTGA